MKKTLYAFAISALLLTTITGCQEIFNDDETAPDGSTPNISISSPNDNSSFHTGQTINITSIITDKDNIQKIEVKVAKVTAGNPSATLWGFTKQPKKNPVVRLDTAFTASALPAGNYVLTLNTIDGRTNVGYKEIKFSVN